MLTRLLNLKTTSRVDQKVVSLYFYNLLLVCKNSDLGTIKLKLHYDYFKFAFALFLIKRILF